MKITDVRVLPGDSAFLIDDGEFSIMYDSGFGFTGDGVCKNIEKALNGRLLDYIFLTHSHYDHALGSVNAKKRWPKSVVVAGEYAAKIFAKPSALAVMKRLDKDFAQKNGVEQYEDHASELRVDLAVSDGDAISAGSKTFEAVHLPGHTRCSMGYYCPEEKLLLGCETLGVFDGEGEVVPAYLVGYQMSLDSIKKLGSFEIKNILVPHFGILNEKQTKLYLKRAGESATEFAMGAVSIFEKGGSVSDVVDMFKKKYYRGHIKSVYPKEAMELNTGIMAELIKKEFGFCK